METKKLVHIIDDHSLFSESLSMLINKFENYKVDFIGRNGNDLIHRLQNESYPKPDIILLDVKMPILNGVETMSWLYSNMPSIPVIALTMEDDEITIIQMIKKGVKGYLLKDMNPEDLLRAMNEVLDGGIFHNDRISKIITHDDASKSKLHFKEREVEFIKLASTDMTYKQIAEAMHLSHKTIDGYREALFHKMEVGTRTGLVLYALRHKIITLD